MEKYENKLIRSIKVYYGAELYIIYFEQICNKLSLINKKFIIFLAFTSY